MQTVTLTLKEKNSIPIEADSITPDNFAAKSKEEVESIPVWYGNTQVPLGDIFDVSCECSESEECCLVQSDAENVKIVMNGDLSRIKRVGQGMTAGEIEINSNIDMHCGTKMEGGKITINGDADSWLGDEMRGGEIVLNGNAGYYVGSGYRGEACGMKGGKITVNGNVRDYLGEHMCGGEIIVNGDAGILPGVSNNGGTIVVTGSTTLVASEMKKGTVVIKGDVAELMPSFKEEGTEEFEGEQYRKFVGDVNASGKGVLLIK